MNLTNTVIISGAVMAANMSSAKTGEVKTQAGGTKEQPTNAPVEPRA